MAKWAETPEMPERIFADPPDIFDGSDIWRSEPGGRAVEYVRADLYRELSLQYLATADQAQEALARAEKAEAELAALIKDMGVRE
jgi:hypothetical protein